MLGSRERRMNRPISKFRVQQGQQLTWLMWIAAKVGSHRDTPIKAPGPGVSPIRVPSSRSEPVLRGASSQDALRAASTAASPACRRSAVPELLSTRLETHCRAPPCTRWFQIGAPEQQWTPSSRMRGGGEVPPTMRFGSAAKGPAKRMLKYYRISECLSCCWARRACLH